MRKLLAFMLLMAGPLVPCFASAVGPDGPAVAQAPAVAVAPKKYFRFMNGDPAHPQMSAGIQFSLNGLSQTAGITDVAIITHSTADGSILSDEMQKRIAPEDLVALQIGGGVTVNKTVIMNVGSSINLAPQVSALLLKGVDAANSPVLNGVKTALQAGGKASFAFGPSFAETIVRDGTMLPISRWVGAVGIFVGAAWHY